MTQFQDGILLGDFNLKKGVLDEYKKNMAQDPINPIAFDDLFLECEATEATSVGKTADNNDFDHIFICKSLLTKINALDSAQVLKGDARLSNHFPLAITAN